MSIIATNKEFWRVYAQLWELGFWMDGLSGSVYNPLEVEASKAVCELLKLDEELVRDKWLLDVGCGPTGRLEYLLPAKGAGNWTALDPLLDRYKTIQGAALGSYDRLVSCPCEEVVDDLLDKFDVIVSINALDHGYDLRLSLQNIYNYLKFGGTVILSFDCFEENWVDYTHPIRVSHREATDIMQSLGFQILEKTNESLPDGVFENHVTNWGGGMFYHWRLTK